MKFSLKFCFFLISIFLFISASQIQSSLPEIKEVDIIQTRITEISWPFESEVESDWTIFSCDITFEIMNNNSGFYVHVGGLPYFIPRINASFVETSLDVGISYVFVTISTDILIKEGIEKRKTGLSFYIFNYRNSTLALGNYTIWYGVRSEPFDFELDPFYTIINVTENKVLITHQGTNETVTYPEEETPSTTSSFLSFSSLLLLNCLVIFRKRNKSRNLT